MRSLRGTNVTIFALFFGLSLLEAVETRDWLRALFWLAIGFVFLRADGLGRQPATGSESPHSTPR